MVDNYVVKELGIQNKDIRIRTLEEADLPGLEWEGEYKHYRRLYADAFERAQQGRAVLWIAEEPGVGLIGQVFIQLFCDRPELADGRTRAYLYAFRVRPAYRGFGLGSQLMETAEEDLRRRGYTYVTLNVARTNKRARRLYERRGFRVIGYEPGQWAYQDDQGSWHSVHEPAWRMEKKLV